MTGDYDYLVRLVVADLADFERIHNLFLTRLPERGARSFELRGAHGRATAIPIRPKENGGVDARPRPHIDVRRLTPPVPERMPADGSRTRAARDAARLGLRAPLTQTLNGARMVRVVHSCARRSRNS